GSFADAWFVDDVRVREMQPDLHLDGVRWTPVSPGGTTTITVDLANRTPIDALDVVVTPGVDPSAGAFDVASVAPGDLAGDGSVSVDLTLTVHPAHPDNARLPFSLTAEAGGETWTWDAGIVVGDASTGHVALTL